MNTYKTLDAARVETDGIAKIIKIKHRDKGDVYIKAKCPMATLKVVLAKKPIPEILGLIEEYSVMDNSSRLDKKIKPGINVPCLYCGTYCHGDCRQ